MERGGKRERGKGVIGGVGCREENDKKGEGEGGTETIKLILNTQKCNTPY